MARLDSEQSGVMSDEGARVQARRERLAMGKRELAQMAGVSRDTLAAIEEGQGFRRSSLTKIEKALDDAEAEAGITAAPSPKPEQGDLMEIRADGVFGIQSIVVGGPVKDRDELVETIAKLIERVRRDEGRNGKDG